MLQMFRRLIYLLYGVDEPDQTHQTGHRPVHSDLPDTVLSTV